MEYLLDSDIIIDLLKNKEPGKSIFLNIPQNKKYISVISWIEIMYGVEKSPHITRRTNDFVEWMNSFIVQVLNIDINVAKEFTKLKIHLERIGFRLSDFDLFIAATAIAHNLTLVTRNAKHFSRIKNLNVFK